MHWHLPTINHIDLSNIFSFPVSSLTSCVNLHRLDIFYTNGPLENIVQLEMTPKIREFNSFLSTEFKLTTKLLRAKGQDGQPAFNFMDLRRLSIAFDPSDSEEDSLRYLLRSTKSLERLRLSVRQSLMGLNDIILSSNASTLEVLDLMMEVLLNVHHLSQPLAGLCEVLEAMAGRYKLETLSFEVVVVDNRETVDFIGPILQKVENILVKPGWSVSLQVVIGFIRLDRSASANFKLLSQ